MTTDLARRGRNAKRAGDEFERQWIRDFKEATGIQLSRQLKERRDGNIGDIEIHPKVPYGWQVRKRKDCSIFAAVADSLEALLTLGHQSHYPVGVCEKRLYGLPGVPNPRGVALHWEDWLEVIQSFDAAPEHRPHFQLVVKTAKTYPNMWAGLEEARALAGPNAIPVCYGKLNDVDNPIVPEGVSGWAFVDYDGFLRVNALLFRNAIW